MGKHELKTGFEHGKVYNDVLSGYSDTGIIRLYYGQNFTEAGFGISGIDCKKPSDGGNCIGIGRMRRFGNQGTAQSSHKGFYIQDKWQPKQNLTLNLGVRLESEFLPTFNIGKEVAGTVIPGQTIGWGKKNAPRFGAAYDLFGDGKTKLYASYGWFYDRLRFQLARALFGSDFQRYDYFTLTSDHPEYNYYTKNRILGNWTDPIGGGNPSTKGGLSQFQEDFRIPANLTREQALAFKLTPSGIDPDLKAFRQDEFTVGLEREIARNYVLSVRFTRKNVAHAIEDHAIVGLNQSEVYAVGNPGEGLDLKLDKEAGYIKSAKPKRIYRALEFTLNRRLSSNFFYNLNYTLSGLYGNYSGLASSDEDGRTDPGYNRFFDYVLNGYTLGGAPDDGYLATDRRHAFKSYGGYTFNKWMPKSHSTQLGYFFTALQGTPQTSFIGLMSTSVPLTKRGDLGRTPALTQLDLSLSHNFKVSERVNLVFNINAFNVFNQNAITNFNTDKYRFNSIAGSDIDPTFDPETMTPEGVFNTVLSGKAEAALSGFFNPSTNPVRNDHGLASRYQSPRAIRLGFQIEF